MKANQSLARAFAVLEFLADNPGARLKDVCAACSLAAATASRFLSNLSELGYIQQAHQGFTVSARLAGLARGIYARDNTQAIQDLLRILADTCKLTAFYVYRDGDEVVYVQRALPQNSSLMNTQRIGHRAPLYCTGVGKIFLASMDDAAIKDYCSATALEALTPKTLCSYAALLPLIKKVRRQGYAFDDEECEIGVKCLAVAIGNVDADTHAEMETGITTSISISGAASLFNSTGTKLYVAALQQTAMQITALSKDMS